MSWTSSLTLLAAGSTFAALSWLESARPLRTRVEPRFRRVARNAALLAVSSLCVALLQMLFLTGFLDLVERRRLGLLPQLGLPRAAELAVAVLLLDYTLWHWHRWNHLVPWLWRFHAVHHADRDLDSSTGARFHFGEMSLSVGYRALQVVTIGADTAALAVWQALLIPCVLFHHSNLRMSPRLERLLVPFVVTPGMHAIHHSNWRDETDSNWSSLLTVWDRLHGTLRLDVPMDAVNIGVPAYDRAEDVKLARMLIAPFRAQPDYWRGRLTRRGTTA